MTTLQLVIVCVTVLLVIALALDDWRKINQQRSLSYEKVEMDKADKNLVAHRETLAAQRGIVRDSQKVPNREEID